MIKATTFDGRRVAVFGLGRTGVSAALSLQAGGAEVWAWDDNESARAAAEADGVALRDLSAIDWSEVDEFVLSPGVPHILPEPHPTARAARVAGVPIICDIEILAREINARPVADRPRVIAITGTNGKSTTTALIGHILKSLGKDAQIGGNIGRGVLDLDRMHAGTHYVLELSSYQLERTFSLRANAAVFLNLSPDHLDRHGTMSDYGAAKERIFLNQTSDDTVVVGVDDDFGKALTSKLKARNGRRIVPISARRALGHGVCALGGQLVDRTARNGRVVCDLGKALALEGMHNAQNAAAAYAAVSSFGIEPRPIGEAILSFPGLAHRMENLGSVGRVRFINDSKGTNAEAAWQALSSYENAFWIAGGVAKDGGIEPLMDLRSNIRKAYLIGEAAPGFSRTLRGASVDCKVSGTLKMAVLCAAHDALASGLKDAVVLLSPACASFDQFRNFEVRGDAFREEVDRLIDLFAKSAEAASRGTAA
ncbi:UDP-N-acetylmuramoyl-L-alanine--D-glutamate ligase [uncultured Algimonas sp.]|uniref:UDP-N-acetylmuramoyl-L-alanine--D-glutamate ligase n=1 Tax=uncultured Algimonas sp. TaxID=1547920 RepID=UPI00261FED6D|nr:UDP-N-acetylmuramoyl-L-alanine--D-glutamate ligase [uncultured Algimonas sp.]